jgi:hypothetical protein
VAEKWAAKKLLWRFPIAFRWRCRNPRASFHRSSRRSPPLVNCLAHTVGCGSLEDRHLQPEGLSPSAIRQTLILTVGGTTNMLNLLEDAGLVIFRPSSAAIHQTLPLSATRLFESRLPASSNGLRFRARKIEKSTASILGLKARVGEQAATNDDVMMEPATGPET